MVGRQSEEKKVVTYDWARSLGEFAQHLLLVFAVVTAIVCALALIALLWPRPRRANASAYYVGHCEATTQAVYVVAYNHVARVAVADPAWGAGAHAEPLASAILRHHTGRRRPPAAQVSALAAWLEAQAPDGFVLERAELTQIVHAGPARVRAARPSSHVGRH